MSERKTAEIKFRCTPSFKAAVQAQAEVEGISASQLLENAANLHIWAEANKKLDGTALADHAIKTLRELPAEPVGGGFILKAGDIVPGPDATLRSLALEPSASFREGVADARAALDAGPEAVAAFLAGDDDDAVPAVEKALLQDSACRGCRPWEFCACKADT